MDFTQLIIEISRGFSNFTWQNGVMILIGLVWIILLACMLPGLMEALWLVIYLQAEHMALKVRMRI